MKRKENNTNKALRYSIRINGSVTSISLRKNLVALWLVLNIDGVEKSEKAFNNVVINFIYKCLDKWKGNNGKGFSDFVSVEMIFNILEYEDFALYEEIYEIL